MNAAFKYLTYLFSLVIILAFSFAVSAQDDASLLEGEGISVLEPQDLTDTEPILIDPNTAIYSPPENIESQIHFRVAPTVVPGNVSPSLAIPGTLHPPAFAQPVPSIVTVTTCTVCRTAVCRCKSQHPVAARLNLVDPKGCNHGVCLNVPDCCTDGAARVHWKGRLFGRNVAKVSWDCCDHESTVIVKRNGKVKVRD